MSKSEFMLSFLAMIISLFPIIFKSHKIIKYFIAKDSKNNRLLVFWNSSKETITKEDLYQLSFIGSRDINLSVDYCNDNIELKIGKAEKYYGALEEKNNTHYYITRLDFDFICPKVGYIIKIENVYNKPIGLLGRIKNENRFSVQYSEEMFWNSLTHFIEFFRKPINFISYSYSIFLLLLSVILIILHNSNFGVGIGILFLLFSIYNIWDLTNSKVPKSLNERLKDKFSDYEKIKDMNKIIYYPVIYQDMYNN